MQYQQIILLGLGLIGNTLAAASFKESSLEGKKEATATLTLENVCVKGTEFAAPTKVTVNYPVALQKTNIVVNCATGCKKPAAVPAKLRRRDEPKEVKSIELEEFDAKVFNPTATFKLTPQFDDKKAENNNLEFTFAFACPEGFTADPASQKASLTVTKPSGGDASMVTYSAFTFFGLAASYYL